MIKVGDTSCPNCHGILNYYDTVNRIMRSKSQKVRQIRIRRLKCSACGSIHREIPSIVFPYKQYEAEVIVGVLEGFITPETLGYEDYPCEMTMGRWKAQKIQFVL